MSNREHRLAARAAAVEAIPYMIGVPGMSNTQKRAAMSYAAAKLSEAAAHLSAAIYDSAMQDMKAEAEAAANELTEEEILSAMQGFDSALEDFLQSTGPEASEEEEG